MLHTFKNYYPHTGKICHLTLDRENIFYSFLESWKLEKFKWLSVLLSCSSQFEDTLWSFARATFFNRTELWFLFLISRSQYHDKSKISEELVKNYVKKNYARINFLSNFKELLVSHDCQYLHPSNAHLLNKLEVLETKRFIVQLLSPLKIV